MKHLLIACLIMCAIASNGQLPNNLGTPTDASRFGFQKNNLLGLPRMFYCTGADLKTYIATGTGVSSIYGRMGVVVSNEGDYTLDQIGGIAISSPSIYQFIAHNGTQFVNVTDGISRFTEIRHFPTNTPLLKFTDVGGSTIAGLEIQNATISGQPTITVNSSSANQAIRIAGKGSSGVRLRANGVDVIDVGSSQTSITSELSLRDNLYIRNAKMLILEDDDELGKVYFKAPTTITSDYTITMPSSAPSPYSSLTYNGSSYEWRKQNTTVFTNTSLLSITGAAVDYGEYTIPANTLSRNGDAIRYTFNGDKDFGGTSAKVTLSVGTNSDVAQSSYTGSGDQILSLEVLVVRTSSTSVSIASIRSDVGGAGGANYTVPDLTTNALNLKFRISSVGIPINARFAKATFEPAP